MIRVKHLSFWLFVAALATNVPASAGENGVQGKLTREALVAALQAGGYLIYIRHASTDHGQTDSRDVDVGNCTTQRNLSPKGREQAQEIGRAFKTLGIPIGDVFTSPYCRAKDTGRLAFGAVVISDDLRFTIRDDEAETCRRAAALRRMLSTPPAVGRNAIIVAHTSNLKEAAGVWPKPEGLAAIFRPLPGGRFTHVASVKPESGRTLCG